MYRINLQFTASALFLCAVVASAGSAYANGDSVVIRQSTVGSIGGNSLGVGGVYENPLSASITLAGRTADIEWESTQTVTTGQEILSNNDCYVFGTITTGVSPSALPGSSDSFVSISKVLPAECTSRGLPADIVVLNAGDASLRIDGPDIERATDMKINASKLDDNHPSSFDIAYKPAHWGWQDTDPADIKSRTVRRGDSIILGKADLTALAIEGRTQQHPARIIWQLKSAK